MTSRYDILLGRVPDEINLSDPTLDALFFVGPRHSGRTTAIRQEIRRFVDDWNEAEPPCLAIAPNLLRVKELVNVFASMRGRDVADPIRAHTTVESQPCGRGYGALFIDDLDECQNLGSLLYTCPFIRASFLCSSFVPSTDLQPLFQRGARIKNMPPDQWTT